ncbi:hypothetical protein AO371_1799 [Moraxella catarrhalis]|nr:hypothetical protein [Moraxella catarrhalis]OAV22673.1 hypothetical protein AO371_1799 [Moraxella catarrhalis]
MAHFYHQPIIWTRVYYLLTTGGTVIGAIRQCIKEQEYRDWVA